MSWLRSHLKMEVLPALAAPDGSPALANLQGESLMKPQWEWGAGEDSLGRGFLLSVPAHLAVPPAAPKTHVLGVPGGAGGGRRYLWVAGGGLASGGPSH